MRKMRWVVPSVCLLLLAVLLTSAPQRPAGAQGGNTVFLPLALRSPQVWLDDFSDNDPAWPVVFTKEAKDGTYEHVNGVLAAHLWDNAALMLAAPAWRTDGSLDLEADVRFTGPMRDDGKLYKSYNSLGLVFGATEDFREFYALMLAEGSDQHAWVVAHFKDTKATWLTNNGLRGAPWWVDNQDGTNHLQVTFGNGTITAYCNGRALPSGTVHGVTLPGNLVGLMVTTYEFSEGEMEFDNYQLTLD